MAGFKNRAVYLIPAGLTSEGTSSRAIRDLGKLFHDTAEIGAIMQVAETFPIDRRPLPTPRG